MSRKKWMGIILSVVLCVVSVRGAFATSAEDLSKQATEYGNQAEELEKNAKELEAQQAAAEALRQELLASLSVILDNIEALKADITAKEMEIFEKEEELLLAKNDENDQYESMKKRIQYMYETGDAQFLEILVKSKSIKELLNNAEYIKTISEYDRDMLDEFQAIVKRVQEQEEALQGEYADLQVMQNELLIEQENLESNISGQEALIGELSSRITEAENAAAELRRKQDEAAKAAIAEAAKAGASLVIGNGFFTHPCPGARISSGFGPRKQPIPGASTYHKGLDLAAPTGTPIYAAAAGTVTMASYSGNAGLMIAINHGNGLATYYMHCSKVFVTPGQKVEKGQNIGLVGSTGNSSGPHLHFQVMVNGTAVDPAGYL